MRPRRKPVLSVAEGVVAHDQCMWRRLSASPGMGFKQERSVKSREFPAVCAKMRIVYQNPMTNAVK